MGSGLADLEARLDVVERRLDELEKGKKGVRARDRRTDENLRGDGVARLLSSHIGRVLLIFGGAYLLRAITEFQLVPTAIGLLMGAAYAVFWLVMAWRKGGDKATHLHAAFFGGTSVLLTLPLLHEATTTFGLLSGTQGVVAIGGYCALAMSVAVRRDLRSLAWLVTAGGIGTAVASLVTSHAAIPVALFLLLLGLGTLWAVYRRGWLGLPWLGAVGANLGVVSIAALAHSDRWSIEPKSPFIVAVALLTTYLASFTYQTHIRGRLVNAFETVQTFIAGGIVMGTAAGVVQGGDLDTGTAGYLSLALGIGGYGLALAGRTRELRYRNFFYYSTFGLAFVLVGTGMLLPLDRAAAVWALLALITAWFSGRTGWVSLSLQCTVSLFAAGVASGLLRTGFDAFAGDILAAPGGLFRSHTLVAIATVACLFIPVAQRSDRWGHLAGLPQLVVLALSVWGVGGLVVAGGMQVFAGAGGTESNPSLVAALRTAVLSVAAVTLALSSRYQRWPEARWLVYPVLLVVGIKLFVEDFPNGQPASLFVALAFIGGALLLVSRLLHATRESPRSGLPEG